MRVGSYQGEVIGSNRRRVERFVNIQLPFVEEDRDKNVSLMNNGPLETMLVRFGHENILIEKLKIEPPDIFTSQDTVLSLLMSLKRPGRVSRVHLGEILERCEFPSDHFPLITSEIFLFWKLFKSDRTQIGHSP